MNDRLNGDMGANPPNEPAYKTRSAGGGYDYYENLFPLHYVNPSWFSIDRVLNGTLRELIFLERYQV